MIILLINLMIIYIMSTLIFMLNFFCSYKLNLLRSKNSSFECGFTQKSSPSIPISIQFYLFCLIFIIFDAELVMLIPMMKSIKTINFIISFNLTTWLFLMIVMSTFMEFYENMFKWEL